LIEIREEMPPCSYTDFALATCMPNLDLVSLALTIPSLLLRQRKDIMTLCRTQFPLYRGNTLWEHMQCHNDEISVPSPVQIAGRYIYTRLKLIDYLSDSRIEQLITSPIYASTISLLLRIAPVPSPDEVDEIIQDSIEKEVNAGINIYHPVCFDYTPIFSSDRSCRFKSLSPRLAPDPWVADDTYKRLVRARDSLHDRILYPACSSKTVGDVCSDRFRELYKSTGASFEVEHRDKLSYRQMTFSKALAGDRFRDFYYANYDFACYAEILIDLPWYACHVLK